MALVPDQKFSTFQNGGALQVGDIIVGLRGGINTKFNWAVPVAVDSITGTANQVLVNGSSGTPVSGNVTLTTPQDIAPTSSPTFASLTLTNPLTGANGGTGVANTGLTINLGSATTGYVLTSDSSGNATWQSVSASGAITTIDGDSGSITPTAGVVTIDGGATGLTTSGTGSTLSLTGTLVVANGGTGLATLTTYTLLAGGATATGNLQQVSAGTSGQLLQSNGAGVLPSWTTATFPSGSGTLNHMLRSDGTNWVQTTATTLDASDVLSGLTQINVDNLRLDGNAFTSTNTDGDISVIPNGNGSVLINSLINVNNGASSPIKFQTTNAGWLGSEFSNGANPFNMFFLKSRSTVINSFVAVQLNDTLGSLLYQADDGTQYLLNSSFKVLVDGAVSAGIIPTRFELRTMNNAGSIVLGMTLNSSQQLILVNPLLPASGGLGISTTPSNGQIPIGNGTNYVASTLTAGTGISITNGSGNVTINSIGGALTWSTVSGTSQSIAVNNGYVSGNSSATTFTLPATAAVGDRAAVEGLGAAGWVLTANTGQTIKIGSSTTSSAGSLTSAESSDNIYVVCIVANTTWRVQTTNSAGLTIT